MTSNKYTFHTIETYNQVIKLRNEFDWGSKKIKNYFKERGCKISIGVIEGWINKNKKPFIQKIISQIPESSKELTIKKAFILGALCGDGYISTGYRIGLSVCDEEFADYFKESFEEIYKVKCSKTTRLRKNTNFSNSPKPNFNISVVSKLVVEDLFRYSASFKSKIWELPQQVVDAPIEIKSAFLRGLYDSEAHVRDRKGQSEINLCSGNNNSLLKVKKMLENDFQIKTYEGKNNSGVSVIVITKYDSLIKFRDLIGFTINRKQDALSHALNSYKRKGIIRYTEEFKNLAMELRNAGLKHKQITILLGTNCANIYDWEKRTSISVGAGPHREAPCWLADNLVKRATVA